MRPVRFVHCSDIHLGCSFKGVASADAGLAGKLVDATYEAFAAIIDLAIDKNVDFVLIAGDLFDDEDRSLKSRLFLRDQLLRLDARRISSYIVCGNHDPLDNWSKTVKLPDSAHVFESGEPQTVIFEKAGDPLASITGISFPTASIKKNLAKKFSRPADKLPAIALLHTDVGSLGRKSYAPCQLKDLENTGFDYWAIGHVHTFNILKKATPAVVYPGCSQGTSPRETGAKGCCLVELNSDNEIDIQFVAVDKMRYYQECVDISGCSEISEIQQKLGALDSLLQEKAEGRNIILRLSLTGRTALHRELKEAACDEIFELAASCLPGCNLDRVIVDTGSLIDRDSLISSGGFPAEVLEESGKLLADDGIKELKRTLSAVSRNCRDIGEFSDDEMGQIVQQAETMLLDYLVGETEN